MKLFRIIFISIGVILVLFIITTFINYRLSEDVIKNTKYYSKSSAIVRISNRLQRDMLIVTNSVHGYILTGDQSFLASYDTMVAENEILIAELTSLLTDSIQLNLLSGIKQANAHLMTEYDLTIKAAKENAADSTKSYNTSPKLLIVNKNGFHEKLMEKLRLLSQYEYENRELWRAKLAMSNTKARQISLVLTVLSVITALFVVVVLVRRIAVRIEKMTQMANSIALGNYDVHIIDRNNDELSSLGYSLNHMAEELSKNISLLKRSNQELDQFAHIVSHDLKSPLRGIDNVVNWINEDHKNELTTKVGEYLGHIKGRVKRAENLIEGLLAYARATKEEVIKETVDVNQLVNEVLDVLPDAEKVSFEIGKLPAVYGEKVLLFQIFANLIGNAIKHNDKNKVVIKIHHQELTASHEFFISDNGIGIPEAHYHRIFVIFQTLKDRDSFESTGVGLSIVKKILDSKKQHISVNSKVGIGSTFSFTWPKD